MEYGIQCSDLLPSKLVDVTKPVRNAVLAKMDEWLSQKEGPKRKEEAIRSVDLPRSAHPLSLIEMIEQRDDLKSFTIKQPVDHFTSSATKKFEQRYWSNLKFYKSEGLRFLMIDGHSPASTMWLTNPKVQIMQLAEKFGAAVYLVEHRGYGKSRLDRTDLEYVTIKQMIADVEQLIKAVNEKEKTSYKWITFGGGYGGSIAAWSRMFRPELVTGAVASSALISPVLDFYKYLLNLQNIIEKRDSDCKDVIEEIFLELSTQLLDSQSRADLSNALNMKPLWSVDSKPTPTDIQFFYFNLLSRFIATIRFDGVNMEHYDNDSTLEKACSILKMNKSIALKLRQFNDYALELLGKKSAKFPNSYKAFLHMLKSTGRSSPNLQTSLYQQCTEFGLFRTTDIGRNIFKSVLPLNFFEELCTDVFGSNLSWKHITQFVSTAAELFKENDERNVRFLEFYIF
ncbi:hypothetical protein AB6A40_009001 [Gnathostoma spinigerum]|uniref:Uncharacterized protein n=1 Tax=Gnathostoma spinigerum TaxID=75299 RepID=A0ABD6EZR3_9BILA